MIGEPIHIEIIGLDNVKEKFPDSVEKMIEVLQDFKHLDDDKYADDIKIEIC